MAAARAEHRNDRYAYGYNTSDNYTASDDTSDGSADHARDGPLMLRARADEMIE
jgi:hypothetical protein